MNSYDLPSLHQFLMSTPESGLRKLFVDQKPMTDIHFNMLMKVVRASTEDAFSGYVEMNDFPKIKYSPNEIKLKENFWKDCFLTFSSRGILNPAIKKMAA